MPALLILGATGLVGGECVRQALAEPRFASVITYTRRPLAPELLERGRGRLEYVTGPLEDMEAHVEAFGADAIICALGTTLRQAGSKEAFRHVDHDLPVAAARLGRRQGARHFLLVSAIGADARSAFFYNRVKGEVERVVRSLSYPSLTIVRPSLLLGERAEIRTGERLATFAARFLGPVVPARYRPVRAQTVAAALLASALAPPPGARVLASHELERYARG